MELEEDIKVVEELINASKLAHLYEGNKYYESIEKLIKYIKEESIPKAVVEEQINKINELLPDIDYHDIKDKQEREFYRKEFMKYMTVRNYLQGLLKKGE